MQSDRRRLTWRKKTALASATVLSSGPYLPLEPIPPSIVDMHCHIAGIGAGNSGCFVSEKLRKSWRFSFYLRSFGVSEKELLRAGDSLMAERISQFLSQSRYVRKAVILAMDGVMDSCGKLNRNRTEIYVPNAFVSEAAAQHSNLLFGASVNPYRNDALEQLVWAKDHHAVLVKWIPSIMEIDPGDLRLEPFYRKLVELNLPLLTHAGQERSFSHATDHFCDPDKLHLPLSLGVHVIAAHIASTGIYQDEKSSDRLARMMPVYPNLYSDISSLTQLNKLPYMKEALFRPEFSGRLVYGSDFPLINTPLVSPWFYFGRLNPKTMFAISRTRNPWDADILLKHHLGTPAEVFTRSEQMFGKGSGQ
jgi:predicted TIM-barrel fold metal-dependent hydrolase